MSKPDETFTMDDFLAEMNKHADIIETWLQTTAQIMGQQRHRMEFLRNLKNMDARDLRKEYEKFLLLRDKIENKLMQDVMKKDVN